MKRFINSKSKTYHHGAIEDFSNSSRFVNGDSTKGYTSDRYSWLADMLFKTTGNYSINPHSCRISFVSNKDIMHQEYANISKINNEYPFFKSITRDVLSKNNHELDTKQYSKIGQKYSEFDLIEYINLSGFISSPVDGYRVNHEFYRLPAFHSLGYKMDLDESDIYVSFDKYIWTKPGYQKFKAEEFSVELDFNSSLIGLSSLSEDLYDDYEYETSVVPTRILDYKINVDNPKYFYPKSGLDEWVYYHNDSEHFKNNSYKPYFGFVKTYFGDSWTEGDDSDITGYDFFPQIIVNGSLEPAKIITRTTTTGKAKSGRLTFNPGNSLGNSEDQSRIVYNTCESMYTLSSGTYKLQMELDSFRVISGIDIDTERNRRFSSVVMTEPYFVTEPLGSGEVVQYEFVDENGNTAVAENVKHVKIKAPLSIISEIDRELDKNEINTDIINVLTIQGITSTSDDINSTALNFYDKFKDAGDGSIFFLRQNACLDDLVAGVTGNGNPTSPTNDLYDNGIVGDATHKLFYITSFGDDSYKYSNNKMKVCGLGVYWDNDSNGDSRMNLNIYCTNYEPINCPEPGVTETPIANDEVEFLADAPNKVDLYSGSEVFKPVLKLPAMNGYIKILKKNKNFAITRSKNGDYEIIYNVEFPYCPGSYSARSASTGFKNCFIYKKKSYINSGSQEVDGNQSSPYDTRYNSNNDRYTPYGDDSFSDHIILGNNSSDFITDPFSLGGSGYYRKSSDTKKIIYPGSDVWSTINSDNYCIALTKPKFRNFRRYGTYQIFIDMTEGVIPDDVKLIGLVDNRKWRFNDDKFSSYIGYENPSYVFEIDTSFISEDFSKYQSHHGAIPDSKRWLYGYFTGFAHTVASIDLDATVDPDSEKINTTGDNNDLTSSESSSDIIVEIWDQESEVSTGDTIGNWRPFMSISSDNHKIPGQILSDNIFIMDSPSLLVDNMVNEFGDIYSIYVGYFEFDETGALSFLFPDSVVNDDVDNLGGKDNLILYDIVDNISFHIAYVERVSSLIYGSSIQQIFKLYVKKSATQSFTTLDPLNISENDSPRYQIRKAFKTINKNIRFSLETITAKDGVEGGYLTRFIDAKGSGNPSNSDRYFVNGKVYFRVRVSRAKKYPSSYESEDINEIPYLGPNLATSLSPEKENFPWYDNAGVVLDAFDWAKIKTKETIRKFGLNYFKCESK